MPRFQNGLTGGLILFSVAIPPLSYAQGGATSSAVVSHEVKLTEISVTATRTRRETDEVPATVSVIDETAIEHDLTQNIKDLIRYEPGVSVPASPARFGNSGYNIRGVEGNRVLIQIDGVRIPETFSFGSFSNAGRDLVDLDSLKTVEILRGPSSTLYGSDALGGVVSYFTKDPADYLKQTGGKPYADLKATYASVIDGRKEGFTLAGGQGVVQGLLQYVRRDGHEPDNKGENDAANIVRTTPNPQDTQGNNWLGKLAFQPDSGNIFKITLDSLDDNVATNVLSSIGTRVTPTRTTTGLRGDDTNRRNRLSLEHQYRNANGKWFQSARWHIYGQDGKVLQHTAENQFNSAGAGSNRLRVRDFTFEQKALGGGLQLESNWQSGEAVHRLIYGLDVWETKTSEQRDGVEFNLTAGTSTKVVGPDSFPVRDFPESDTLQAGLFVQDEIALRDGRFNVIPGLRYDYYKLTPRPDNIFTKDNPGITPVSIKDSALSPKFGAIYKLDNGMSLYGQYAHGFRAPPYSDANIGFTNLLFGYTTIPNPDLKSETSKGIELGLRGKSDRGTFGVALFDNRYKDFIDSLHQLTCPGDPKCVPGLITFQSINLNKVRIFGLEVKGSWKLDRTLALKGGFAYAHGDNQQTDQPLNSIDPIKLVAGLQYTQPGDRFGGEIATTLVAAKDRVDTSTGNLFKSPGYGLVDVFGRYNFSRQAALNFGVFNLLDKKYWHWSDVRGQLATDATLDRFTQPGRNASASFRYQF